MAHLSHVLKWVESSNMLFTLIIPVRVVAAIGDCGTEKDIEQGLEYVDFKNVGKDKMVKCLFELTCFDYLEEWNRDDLKKQVLEIACRELFSQYFEKED